MTSSRLVRGTKGRLFACLGVLTLFAGVLFLYHSTRVELDEVRNAASKCRQEQESLAAQLQVIFEYKVRLEKSLQQEKADHRQTKEELQTRMTDEQQVRDRENLENVNKYKALQQQYKLLRSEYGDLNDDCNKVKSERTSCAETRSQLESQIKTLQLQLAAKDSLNDGTKARCTKIEKENKDLHKKIETLENVVKQERSHLPLMETDTNPKETDQHKREAAALEVKGSSTKDGGRAGQGGVVGVESAGGNQAGYLEPPQKAFQASQKSSTAAQEDPLAANPVQSAPLQSIASNSKVLNKHSTTPQINPDALQSQDKSPRPGAPAPAAPAPPAAVAPLPPRAAAAIDVRDSNSNGLQGVLPAPFAFQIDTGSENHQRQGALPLEAPYKQQHSAHQDILQNQGQMPPLAHLAPLPLQSGVLPLPPGSSNNHYQHVSNLNPKAHQQINPFQNGQVNHHAFGDLSDNQNRGLFDAPPQKSIFDNVNHFNTYEKHKIDFAHLENNIQNDGMNRNSDLNFGVPDTADHGYAVHNKAFARSAVQGGFIPAPVLKAVPHHFNQFPIHNNHLKDNSNNINNNAQLVGDINHIFGGNKHGDSPMGVGNHGHLGGAGQGNKNGQEIAQPIHYNYQGGDYDKEEHPAEAQGEEDDEDVDQIDYNNDVANQAQPALKMGHRRFAGQQLHQDAVMVNPR